MLVDDDSNDNFFHERIINKSNSAKMIVSMESGPAALEYIKSKKGESDSYPDLIFLDINMPGMNGWDFLDEYNKLGQELQKPVVIIMLTTSENPDDKKIAMSLNGVSDFTTKPLTKLKLEEVFDKYFGKS